ncbi:MAG: aa3-type cytochrome c oxidase subunit IV [Rhodobiaceae bacterium]|nr:aa3-type cytochrome c oxidase subunit IV [Rhodobiaceae bacterium]
MSDDTNSQEWGEEMNRPEHESTYESFLTYSKWGSIGVALILAFLIVFVYD